MTKELRQVFSLHLASFLVRCQGRLGLADFVKEQERIQLQARSAQSLLYLDGNSRVIDQALAGSLGTVVALEGPTPSSFLGDQFEGRLEEVGVEAD